MNVMINDISEDLDTTVQGVQTAITLFLLIMAVLMIPCSKLTDRWGRKRCFLLGLVALRDRRPGERGRPEPRRADPRQLDPRGRRHGAADPAGLHPRDAAGSRDLTSRARAFGVISGLGGIGAAAGPLIGGLITTAISWRAAFIFQALVDRRDHAPQPGARDPLPADPTRPFDTVGAVLSAVGMLLIVLGHPRRPTSTTRSLVVAARGRRGVPRRLLPVHPGARARREGAAALDAAVPQPDSNLALVTQNVQWLLLMGTSFVVSVYLQVVRGYSAIETGVIFTAATAGILVSSLAAERLAKRHAQRTLIVAGFVVTIGRHRAADRPGRGLGRVSGPSPRGCS